MAVYERQRRLALTTQRTFESLARDAVIAAASPEWLASSAAALNAQLERFEKGTTVEISVIGRFRTGKTTLVNALLGSRLLRADVNPTTAVLTRARHGKQLYGASVKMLNASAPELEQQRDALRRVFKAASDTTPIETESLTGCEQLLGAFGALGPGSVPSVVEVEKLLAYWRDKKELPSLPNQDLLGKEIAIEAESATALEEKLRPYIAFPSAGGSLACYLVDEATLWGPFELLRPGAAGDLPLELVDTPGLEDVSLVARERTYKQLERADCVILNLGDLGNLSHGDREVVQFLYRRNAKVTNLILVQAKVDQVLTGDVNPVEYFKEMLPKQIVQNRGRLKLALIDAGIPEADAEKISQETPVIPVSALAALERRVRAARGEILDAAKLDALMRDRSRRDEANRATDFPSDQEDGFGRLHEGIRGCLDEAHRIKALIGEASETLRRCVAEPRSWLESQIAARSAGIDGMKADLASLEGKWQGQVEALETELQSARNQVKKTWGKQLDPILEEFLGRQSAELANKQHRLLTKLTTRYRESAQKGGMHWKTLEAIVRHEGRHRDNLIIHDIMNALFVPTFVPAAKQFLFQLAGQAQDTLGSTAAQSQEKVGTFVHEVIGEKRLSEKLRSELEKCYTSSKADLERALTALIEGAHKQVDTTFGEIVLKTVHRWTKWYRENEGSLRGRGYKQSLLDGFSRIWEERLETMPADVRERLGPELTKIAGEAQEIGAGMFKDIASVTRKFVTQQLQALQEGLERRQTEKAETLAAEADQLREHLKRLLGLEAEINAAGTK